MFCQNCGKELQEGAKFCIYCGTPTINNTPVNGESDLPTAETQSNAESTVDNPYQQNATVEEVHQKGRTGIVVGIVAAVLVAVIIGVVFMVKGSLGGGKGPKGSYECETWGVCITFKGSEAAITTIYDADNLWTASYTLGDDGSIYFSEIDENVDDTVSIMNALRLRYDSSADVIVCDEDSTLIFTKVKEVKNLGGNSSNSVADDDSNSSDNVIIEDVQNEDENWAGTVTFTCTDRNGVEYNPYKISIPKAWKGKYITDTTCYEDESIASYWLTFKHTASYEASGGCGDVLSLGLYDGDFEEIESQLEEMMMGEIVGTITCADGHVFYLFYFGNQGIMYTDETWEEYHELSSYVEAMIESITVEEGSTFEYTYMGANRITYEDGTTFEFS